MKTLLRVDASARIEGSHSKMLADFFQLRLNKKATQKTDTKKLK